MLVKVYEGMGAMEQRRYSPSKFVNADKRRINGAPDMEQVSTSYVERQNLTIRMHNPPLHATDQCVLKENREFGALRGAALYVLQLRSHP